MKLFSSALKHLSGVWQAAIADFRVQLYAKKVEVSAAFIELLRAYRLRYEAATHALGANSRDVALPRRVCCRRQCRTMRAALQTSASCATSSGSSLRTYPQASAGTPRRPWACPRRRTCATRLAIVDAEYAQCEPWECGGPGGVRRTSAIMARDGDCSFMRNTPTGNYSEVQQLAF